MQKFFSKVSILSVAGMLASGVAFAQIEVSNENTGADSDNDNTVDVTTDFDEDITNSAEIENAVEASTETGDNESNENTGGGEVDTGNAEIDGELENEVNSSAVEFYTVVFGDIDGELENDTTGSESDNTNDVDVSQSLEVDLSNGAWLLNALGLAASSGDNTANENTGGGEVQTGDAEIAVAIMNEINAAYASSTGSFGDVDIEASNHQTGSDSENDNTVDVTQDIEVDVTNSAEVSNAVESAAATGDNESNDNTGGGSVDTGNAETDTEIANAVNAGGSGYAVTLPDVDVEASNDTTGSDSDNTNDVDVSNTASVEVSNSADISNEVGSSADSGGNSANENTGGGEVQTGNASVGISISNTVN